jgi:alpha-galactosidase
MKPMGFKNFTMRLLPAATVTSLLACAAVVSMAAVPGPGTTAAQSAPAQPAFYAFAPTPPLGWNSYDAFGDSVTEAEVLANATYVKDKLLAHGWNYIVVDFRWYDPEPTGDDHALNQKRTGAKLASDGFGRMVPAENRFPSSAGGKGFKPLADTLHGMGLKFGFHYMRGIPRQSVNNKTPIEGSTFTAADAGDPRNTCGWCPDMYGVRSNEAGQAWYDAMFKLYASWGLDYIKVDDFSNPYRQPEIEMVRKAIDKCGRAIVLSTSAGPTPVNKADHVKVHANLWRISGDFWDTWAKLNQQFDLMNSWKEVAGPGHFPDADMIPFGHICIRSKAGGNDRTSRYTHDEQTTLMSFWCLAPSPLMLGGNLPDNTEWDLSVLTNDEVLAVNQDPLVRPATRISQQGRTEVWMRPLKDGSRAAGLFNRSDAATEVSLNWEEAKLSGKWTARDLWQHKDLGPLDTKLARTVPPHGAVLLKLSPGAK